MASKAEVEKPISLVCPAQAKMVQAILDRAHKQEKAARKALARKVDRALRPKRSKGILSKTLGLALSHHGRTKKGAPSLRATAPDTNGRSFHFSHTTVRRTPPGSGLGSSGGAGPAAGDGASPNGGGDSAGEAKTAASGSTGGKGATDLGSKEAGHQRYVERDAALARDAAEEYGFIVGGQEAQADAARGGPGEGREPGRDRTAKGKLEEKSAEADAATDAGTTKARPIEMNLAALQKDIARATPGRKAQSPSAAQTYIEDASKVAPQVRHGHSNSFGTIGATFEERVAFWNDVQQHEREKDARTQYRLVLELPHEASPAARQEIVKRFCADYERLGVPYWASIHSPTKKNDHRNHHAHIVYANRPARRMAHPETGQEVWDFTVVETYRKKNRVKKTRHKFRQNTVAEFRNRDYIRDTRKRFAEVTNEVLQEHGCPVRYDPRSYKDMGLDVEPMKHVGRIQSDKAKLHDFVVMDPEWTRRMINQEMMAAAIERDKTYARLKAVESQLADATKDIASLSTSNAKLPKALRLAPMHRMTKLAARHVSRKILEAEAARVAQRFADEATTRTIQHVIDATAPVSAHRDGKARRTGTASQAAPDAKAMAILHAAATEEMRLHRLETAGRMRAAGMRVKAAYQEWRQAATPNPPQPPPAQDDVRPKAGNAGQAAKAARPPVAEAPRAARAAARDNTTMGIMMRHSTASPAMKARMAAMSANMHRQTDMIRAMSSSGAEFAEAILRAFGPKVAPTSAATQTAVPAPEPAPAAAVQPEQTSTAGVTEPVAEPARTPPAEQAQAAQPQGPTPARTATDAAGSAVPNQAAGGLAPSPTAAWDWRATYRRERERLAAIDAAEAAAPRAAATTPLAMSTSATPPVGTPPVYAGAPTTPSVIREDPATAPTPTASRAELTGPAPETTPATAHQPARSIMTTTAEPPRQAPDPAPIAAKTPEPVGPASRVSIYIALPTSGRRIAKNNLITVEDLKAATTREPWTRPVRVERPSGPLPILDLPLFKAQPKADGVRNAHEGSRAAAPAPVVPAPTAEAADTAAPEEAEEAVRKHKMRRRAMIVRDHDYSRD